MKIDFQHHDLVTPDGKIIELQKIDDRTLHALVHIEGIHSQFKGFEIEPNHLLFNIKSTLAQVGVNGVAEECELSQSRGEARIRVRIHGIGPIGKEMLGYIEVGAYIGKLFAADERRRVRDPVYISRMFGRSDRWGRPLLSLGGMHGSDAMILDKVEGRTVAYLSLKNGKIVYNPAIFGFLPTLGKGLVSKFKMRDLLHLHQEWVPNVPKNAEEDEILLVKTPPLHIRTVFARVVDSLVTPGYHHTSASVLQPDTRASGDVYEFFGSSKREITDLPLEFYTLEPYREHVFFSDRDQLQTRLEDDASIFKAFETAPQPEELHTAVFVVKGHQMEDLKPDDWIACERIFYEFPDISYGARQALLVERYISHQPSYPFLNAIEDGYITSQGVLFMRYFPSPMMKRMLLSEPVARCLKGIFFQYPSHTHKDFFSIEDRALLNDLHKFAIPVYWVDRVSGKVLQYMQKRHRETGMFVPREQTELYLKTTVFGVYGSNLISGNFDKELKELLKGVLDLRQQVNHPLLQKDTPLALMTGGGPGAMEMGNRIAKELQILSCANIADFHVDKGVVNEQKQNPYIEA